MNKVKMRFLAAVTTAFVATAMGVAVSGPAVASTTAPAPSGSTDFYAVANANEQHVLSSTPKELMNESAVEPNASTFTITATSPAGVQPFDSGYLNIACKGKVNNPHYSSGALGAIFKTVITCTGTGASSVRVHQKGLLSFSSSGTGTFASRATSDYFQDVAVNGASRTYYTPKSGSGGGGYGYWEATSTWQITSPGVGTIGTQNALWYGYIS